MQRFTSVFAFLAAVALSSASTAGAETYVWENVCSEDQISNSGVGDGSTDSTATGSVLFRAYDPDPSDNTEGSERIFYDVNYSGLEGLLTKIHIHGPAALGASNPGHVWDVFRDEVDIAAAGVDLTTDRYRNTETLFTLMLNSNGLTTSVPEDHFQFMLDELAYANIHTDLWPMGEIRCQLFLTDTILTDPQTKDQRKCSAAQSKGLGKIVGATAKRIGKCFKDSTKGRLTGLLEDCAATTDDKTTKQINKAAADFTNRCSGDDKNGTAKLPTFGVTDAATTAAAAELQPQDIVHDVFGSDLDLSIDDGTDKALGSCQTAAAKAVAKCEAARVKEYNTCVKDDLKGKVDLPIVDDHGFTNCLENDRKDKILKACGADDGKARASLEKKCEGVDLAVALPGCGTSDLTTAAACIDASAACRVCLAASSANGVTADCDMLDDGLANASCSP